MMRAPDRCAPVRRPHVRSATPLRPRALRECVLAVVIAVQASACSSGGGSPGVKGSGGATASGSGGAASTGGSGSGGAASGGATGSVTGSGGEGTLGGSGGAAGGTQTGGSNGATGGGSGGARATGGAGGSPGGAGSGGGGGGATVDPNKRHLLLRDEAQSMVSYVELGNPAAGWHVTVPYGRDLQLVGGGRFLIGTDSGFEERALATGAMVTQNTAYVGTQTAHRLRNGDTILAGANWQGGSGIILVELDPAGAVARKITYAGFSYVRLIRQTPTGTFLVTADTVIFEGDATGKILWRANVVGGPAAPHVWQALRVPSGDTVVTTGYAASIEIFNAAGTLRQTITGPANVTPNFYGGFQILPNGNFMVANWLGHMGEVAGVQLLEYNPAGTLVWSYRPNAATESLSLHHVIVLDGLDVSKLHVDDTTGILVPVP